MSKNPIQKSPKKTTFGLETEMFTLNDEGTLLNQADVIMDLSKKNKILIDKVRKEISLSMVEMGSDPQKTIPTLASTFLKKLSILVESAEKEGIHMLPLGCYPGPSKSKLRDDPWYRPQEFILGKEGAKRILKICGYHFHFSLPKGVVSKKSESIQRLKHVERRELFLNLYNFSVAAEPVCMTICQSSPFFEGKNYAKDCRTIIYRDMAIQDEIYGTYEQLSILGGLPHYEFTMEDLRDLSTRRKNLYLDILRSKNFPTNEIAVRPDLKFMWGPMRVNQIGTLEFRGFDMNYPSYLFASASLLEHAIDGIKENELQTIPSDVGLEDPFKLDGENVYLPPFSTVKSIELLSTRYGFDNSSVLSYCTSFLNFVCKISKFKKTKQYSFIKKMIDEKKTMSDKILSLVKKNGHDPKHVPDDFFKYIASYYAKGFQKDIQFTIDSFKE